jgi:putative FmdB family regulatory protein
VPTYEYQCDKCQRVFEVRQRISDPPLVSCETCGGSIRRLLSPAPFILKGGGWYVTDYPSASRKKAMEADKSPSTTSEAKSDGKSSTTEPASTKSSGSDSSSSSPPSSSSASSST